MSMMNKEVFGAIQVGQEVKHKDNWLLVTGRAKGGQLLCGEQVISRMALKSTDTVRDKPNISKQRQVQDVQGLKNPKEKHSETVKLEALISNHPDKKDEIFIMALDQNLTVEEINLMIVMGEAGIKVRA